MLAKKSLVLGASLIALAGLDAMGCNLVTGAGDLDAHGTGGGGGSGSDASSSSSGSAPSSSSTGGAASSSSTGGASSTSSSTSASSSTSSSTSSSGSVDPFEQNRQDCIDKINALRATKGLSAYQRWTSAEACVDQQASHDASAGIAHDAFSKGMPSCGGSGQNECPGWGADGITGCLQQMWNEKDQPDCAGCDACDTFTIFQGQCPKCVFNGATVCGHYVNMSSKTFVTAACGFSTTGGWDAINFQ